MMTLTLTPTLTTDCGAQCYVMLCYVVLCCVVLCCVVLCCVVLRHVVVVLCAGLLSSI